MGDGKAVGFGGLAGIEKSQFGECNEATAVSYPGELVSPYGRIVCARCEIGGVFEYLHGVKRSSYLLES